MANVHFDAENQIKSRVYIDVDFVTIFCLHYDNHFIDKCRGLENCLWLVQISTNNVS